jgi:hypothetical protein
MDAVGEKAKTGLIRLPPMPTVLIYSNIVPIDKILDNLYIFNVLYKTFDGNNPKILFGDPLNFPVKQETVPFPRE